MERRTFLAQGLAAAGILGLAGCHDYYEGPPPHARAYGRRYGGPPPHAPANGYRYKYDRYGVDLVFDAGLGVYVVAGLGSYFYNDRFYRWHGGYWQYSARPRGPWHRAAERSVPRRLYRKYRGRGRRGRDYDRDRDRDRRGY